MPRSLAARRFLLVVTLALSLHTAGCRVCGHWGCGIARCNPDACSRDGECAANETCTAGECVSLFPPNESGPLADSMVAADSTVPGTDAMMSTDAVPPGTDAVPPGTDAAPPGTDSAVPGTDAGFTCGMPGDPCTGMPVGTCCPGNFCCCGPGGCICDQC